MNIKINKIDYEKVCEQYNKYKNQNWGYIFPLNTHDGFFIKTNNGIYKEFRNHRNKQSSSKLNKFNHKEICLLFLSLCHVHGSRNVVFTNKL